MPELPEVETIKTALEKAIGLSTIINVSIYNKNLREKIPDDLPQKIIGARICKYERRAKYILIHLNNNICLILHLGMSGQIKISRQESERIKHDHVVIETTNGFITYHDARRFGLLTYFDEKENVLPAFLHNLGPEPFYSKINGKYLYQKLQAKKVPIKVALLDQSVIVGIGNIYASESLYEARILPIRPANSLSLQECTRLLRKVREVLQKAISAGGSTLRDYHKPDGSLGYFQNMHCVYNKTGSACPDCCCDLKKTGGIQKIVLGGRSTFFCSSLQK